MDHTARPPTGHHQEPAKEATAKSAPEELAECPVMIGTTVVKSEAKADGLVREHGGRRYWLCCDTCADLFDGEPERYATEA